MILVIKANLGIVNLAPSTEPDTEEVEKQKVKYGEEEKIQEEETCL